MNANRFFYSQGPAGLYMGPDHPQTHPYVLFIDPNLDVRLALGDFLESVSYRVKLAATGSEALQALEENLSFTAVIVDIALPDMEGMDLLKAIGRFNPHLPVIVLTGITELDREIRTFQHGAFAFLHKPYNREEVLALLGKAVNFHNMLERMTAIQEALQTSEERFRRVVTVSRDVIILADEQGYIIGWNEAAQTLFGYQAEEIMGHSLTTIIPDRFRAAHRQGMEHYLHIGQVHALGKTLEIQGLRKDGSEIPIELSLSTWRQKEQIIFLWCYSGDQ